MKKIEKPFKLAGIILTFLLLLSSCDNSSTIFSTEVKGKAVDGYITNAIACLDTEKTYTCTDETKYISKTDELGNYSLGVIANSELNRYNIVIETTDDSYSVSSLDPLVNSSINAGKVLMAPGYLSANKELIITPLLSLITRNAEADGLSFEHIYIRTMEALGISTDIDITRIDFIKHQKDDIAFGALKVLNEELFNFSVYDDYFKSKVDGANQFSGVLESVDSKLGQPFSDLVTLDSLEKHVKARLLDSFDSLLPEEEVDPGPSLTPSGEYEAKQDAADGANMIRTIAIEAISLVPKIGWVVGPVLDIFWEEDVPNFDKELYNDLVSVIDQRIFLAEKERIMTEIKRLKITLDEFRVAGEAEHFPTALEKFKLAYVDTKKNFERIVESPVLRNRMIPQAVFFFNMRMILHKERYANYQELGNGLTQKQVLDEWIFDYETFRDSLLVTKHDNKTISELYLEYRASLVQITSGKFNFGFLWLGEGNEAKLTDTLTQYSIHMKSDILESRSYHYGVTNIKTKLVQVSKLNLAKQLSSIFLLPRLFPEGVSLDRYASGAATNLSSTEKLGAKAYFVPEAFKTIGIGSINRQCQIFLPQHWNEVRGTCHKAGVFEGAVLPDYTLGISSMLAAPSPRYDIESLAYTLGNPAQEVFPTFFQPLAELPPPVYDGYYLIGVKGMNYGIADNSLLHFTAVFAKNGIKNKITQYDDVINKGGLSYAPAKVLLTPVSGSYEYKLVGFHRSRNPTYRDDYEPTINLIFKFFPDEQGVIE